MVEQFIYCYCWNFYFVPLIITFCFVCWISKCLEFITVLSIQYHISFYTYTYYVKAIFPELVSGLKIVVYGSGVLYTQLGTVYSILSLPNMSTLVSCDKCTVLSPHSSIISQSLSQHKLFMSPSYVDGMAISSDWSELWLHGCQEVPSCESHSCINSIQSWIV